MIKQTLAAFALTALSAGPVLAGNAAATEPPAGGYKQVSSLVALPEFIPGLGSLYVDPNTLPAGPFAAYDKDGKLVSTIYMVPVDDMKAETAFSGLNVAGDATQSVDLYYNAGHPGVDVPHYHIVLWHVDPDSAMLE